MFRNLFSKIEKLFFYLFIFCLPFQTRLFLFGRKDFFNEWSSGFLYLSDLLFFTLLCFWAWRIFWEKERPVFKDWRLEIILGVFWLLAGISIFQALETPLAVFGFLKLTELLLLFFYLKHSFCRFAGEKAFFVFLLAAVFQGALGLAQFFKQKDLGLKLLGESPLGADIPGVAKVELAGEKVIRAYGALPHPNLLGVLMFLALIFFLAYILKRGFKTWQIAPLGIIFGGLFFSFSRLAIFVFAVSFLVLFVWGLTRKVSRRRALGTLCLLAVFFFLFFGLAGEAARSRFDASQIKDSQSVDLRKHYAQIGWEMFKQRPFGVGINSFTAGFIDDFKRLGLPVENWMFQPIHNLYFLIAVETGFIGLVIFLWFLVEIFRRLWRVKEGLAKIVFWPVFLSFLFLGFFDHYFWTLQQGQLLFWGLLGIIAGYDPDPS